MAENLIAQFNGHRPRIGLVGFFGWGNYGDELFLQGWKQNLSEHFQADVVHDLLKAPYFSGNPYIEAEKYDAFVIGGGDLVIPNKVSELYWHKAWLKKKVFIAGIGVPTWIRHEDPAVMRHMRNFFRHPNVQYIGVRDVESADWIRQKLQPRVEVRVAPDLVYGLDMPPARRYPEDKVLGVAVRQRRITAEDDYTPLASLVDEARNQGYAVKALVLGGRRTGEADAKAVERLPFAVDEVIRSEDMTELSAALGGLDVLASMKFHGSLVASMYGVPAIVLSPTTKSKNLFKALGRTELLSSLGDAEMAQKLAPAQTRISAEVIERQKAGARAEMQHLVHRLRLQLAPGSVFRPEGRTDWDAVRREGRDYLTVTAGSLRIRAEDTLRRRVLPPVRATVSTLRRRLGR